MDLSGKSTSDPVLPEDAPPAKSQSKARSALMFVISAVLLVGAVYFVYRSTDGFTGVWDSVKAAPWWMIALIVISPMGNHLSVAMCLHALQNRHGRVGVREMFVLIGSAWMFNYLPMRAGLIGRIGYHKSINKIRLRDSIESSIWSGVLAGISNVVLLLVAFVMTLIEGRWGIALPAVPVAMMFIASWLVRHARWRLVVQALAYRQIDVIVWLVRYWIAFEVLGLEMSIADIAVVSAVSQLASLMPLTGSGIGFREWAVGLMASVGGHAMGTAMAGDIINRAAETLIVVPVGLVCTAFVARHWKRAGALRELNSDGELHGSGSTGLSEDHSGSDAEDQYQAGDPGEQDQSER